MIPFPEIQDIAPPVEPVAAPGLPWGWWISLGILTLLALTLLVWWIIAWRRRLQLPGLPLKARRAALQALSALRERSTGEHAGAVSPQDFAQELSGIVRTFLHRQTGILANFSTSPEILGERSRAGQPPPPPVVQAFRRVLLDCDRLKFGTPDSPDPAAFIALLDDAAAVVDLAGAPVDSSSAAAPPPLPPPLKPETPETATTAPAASSLNPASPSAVSPSAPTLSPSADASAA